MVVHRIGAKVAGAVRSYVVVEHEMGHRSSEVVVVPALGGGSLDAGPSELETRGQLHIESQERVEHLRGQSERKRTRLVSYLADTRVIDNNLQARTLTCGC